MLLYIAAYSQTGLMVLVVVLATITFEGTGAYPVVTTVLLVLDVVEASHTAQQQQAMIPTTHAISATNNNTLTTMTTINLYYKKEHTCKQGNIIMGEIMAYVP